jgi:hypothetical protein
MMRKDAKMQKDATRSKVATLRWARSDLKFAMYSKTSRSRATFTPRGVKLERNTFQAGILE